MAKRRGRQPALASASIADLERALANRRRDVERLSAQRDRLAAHLAEVENELRAVQGLAPAGQPPAPRAPAAPRARRSRRGAGSGPTLQEAITAVLKGASGPLRLTEIAERVKASGYETRAKNFTHPVHKALGQHPQAKKVGRGLYAYKDSHRETRAKPEADAPKRPRGSTSLAEAVTQVLKAAGGPMRVVAVAEAVRAAGYSSKAKRFDKMVHKALNGLASVERVGRGMYVYAVAAG